MKRFLLTGLMILGLGQFATYAQQRGSYKDDIYYNSKDAQKDAETQKKNVEKASATTERTNDDNTYNSSGNENDNSEGSTAYRRSYESDADGDGYIDANDDFYYSSRVRRFGYTSYGFGYYSPFYDPFWYDPWYSPYWGPRSGVVISMGWGYPYGAWGPGYGYGWGYPYGGWGYPYGGGYWAGYNNGFYDGYYGGGYVGYGGYGNYRSVNYGPRSSLGANSYGPRVNRNTGNTAPQSGTGTGPIRQLKQSQPDNGSGAIVNEPTRPARSRSADLPDRAISTDPDAGTRTRRFEPAQGQQVPEQRMQRNRVFGGRPQQGTQTEGARPRFEQRQQQAAPAYEQPRYQQSAPRYEQPRMSAPSRSGSSGGGYNGGSSGGRRR